MRKCRPARGVCRVARAAGARAAGGAPARSAEAHRTRVDGRGEPLGNRAPFRVECIPRAGSLALRAPEAADGVRGAVGGGAWRSGPRGAQISRFSGRFWRAGTCARRNSRPSGQPARAGRYVGRMSRFSALPSIRRGGLRKEAGLKKGAAKQPRAHPRGHLPWGSPSTGSSPAGPRRRTRNRDRLLDGHASRQPRTASGPCRLPRVPSAHACRRPRAAGRVLPAACCRPRTAGRVPPATHTAALVLEVE